MRFSTFFAAVFLPPALALNGASAKEIETKSAVSAVTIYPDAASVTREAVVDLPDGESTIVFTGAPYATIIESVRAAGEAQTPLVIGSVEARIAPKQAKTGDSAVEARLKELRGARAEIEVTIEALKAKQAMILRYSQASPEGKAEDAKSLAVSKWTEAFDAIGAAYAKAGEELRLANARAQALDEEIRGLQGTGGAGGKQGLTRDIAVVVESHGGGRAKLKLMYQTRGAGWRPSYDARLDTGEKDKKSAVELLRRAVVTQQTGEDWRDVALSVSTIRAQGGAAAPEVSPQRVAFFEPMPVPMPRAQNAPMASVAGAMKARKEASDADKVEEAQRSSEATAELEATAYAATFRIAGAVSVPGDGAPKGLLLSSRQFEPKLTIRTAPALDPTAYLEARIFNDEDAPLLAGQLNVQRDGVFVGSSRIALVAPGEGAEIGFGADDKVKVTRVPVKRRENEPGWFGQTRTDVREFKTSVKNLHAFPVSVTVVDQIPFSENSAITVELMPHTTPPSEKQPGDKRGVMSWSFDLQAGESKDIHLAYRLKWPADREIVLQPAPLAR